MAALVGADGFAGPQIAIMIVTKSAAIQILNVRLRSINILVRKTCKIAAEVDEGLVNKLENNELKPRQHPGIVKNKLTELPPRIGSALQHVIKDHPVKSILTDGRRLNQYITSRHPPPERAQIRQNMRIVVDKVNERMPLNDLENLSEEEAADWRRKRDQKIKHQLAQRTYAWKPIEYGDYEAIVYAITRGAKEYGILARILLEIKLRDPDFKPRSYFDFGSGVGTGMWAASTLWEDTIFEYYNVDRSREMNDLSELILCGGIENKDKMLRNVYYRQFLPALDTKYDLVVTSFSLFELPGQQARQDVLLNLWQKCDGYLIIAEEGTRRGSELINEARDYLLGLKDDALKGHVLAPCPHDSPCPRLSNPNDLTPCNFEVSYVPLRLGNEGKIDKATARYSYVVLKKGPIQDATLEWPRLVRSTLVRSGHIICRMCTANAKLQEIIFTQSKHGRIAYRCAKASRWGDRLPIKIGENFENQNKSEEVVEIREDVLSQKTCKPIDERTMEEDKKAS